MISNYKAIKAGLTFRKLESSVRDTYDWWYSDSLTDERRNMFETDANNILNREGAILEKWKNYKKG